MDFRDQLQRTLGDAYVLERELAGGGMSRVFVAREAALGRLVVVKVVRGATAGSVSIERFKREIQLAARLQHPHIVPLLTAGESEGLPYFTMPFVEGESLRVRLARGRELPVAEGARILREVAAALVSAHEKGIVHRDIKPDNVLLSGGAAMVTDFGVAKAISVSTDAGIAGVTSVGFALGTPAYMAPEQAAGSPDVDARADIYAWGILAYELFAGRPPFSGRSQQATLSAHMTETPENVLKLRPTLPPSLAGLIMRCLEKLPADRPQSAGEIINTLDSVTTPGSGSEPARAPKSVASSSVAAAGPHAKRVVAVLSAVVAVALIVWLANRLRAPTPTIVEGIESLAVLPFASSDSSSEFTTIGIANDVRSGLIRGTQSLKVTSASTSNSYRGKQVNVKAVGESLNVAYVVTGEALRSREGTRLTVSLDRTVDNTGMWSESCVLE